MAYSAFCVAKVNMPRFEKGTRFYTLTLEQDLLDDWVVVTVYGRTSTSLGQVRIHAFTDREEAQRYFDAECRRRVKRGYDRTKKSLL